MNFRLGLAALLTLACHGLLLQQLPGFTKFTQRHCSQLDAARVICRRNGTSVLAPTDGSNKRLLRFKDACAIETAIHCKGDLPAPDDSAGLCSGDCGACPCEYDASESPTEELMASYMQTMVGELQQVCASEEPTRLMLIGLGGGILVHHFLHHCEMMRVDAVEISGEIVSQARQFFGIGEAETMYKDRLLVEETDALNAVSKKQPRSFDVVVVDCFLGGGVVPESCRSRDFVENVRRILKPSGVMLQNMWGRSPQQPRVVEDFTESKAIYSDVFRGSFTDLHVPMRPGLDFVHVLKGGGQAEA